MGFSRQGYGIGLLCPPPGDFPDPGIEPVSLMPSALANRVFTTEPPGKSPTAAAAAKSLQSCLTLCDPIDCSPPGSCVRGIPQARILE